MLSHFNYCIYNIYDPPRCPSAAAEKRITELETQLGTSQQQAQSGREEAQFVREGAQKTAELLSKEQEAGQVARDAASLL